MGRYCSASFDEPREGQTDDARHGYGASGKPSSAPDHAPHTKRAMARDLVQMMKVLGFDRFSVARHDCGGRVGYRLALDHADRIKDATRRCTLTLNAAAVTANVQ
jgi:pimeloyl-ACP methyl ester carboxylesterase